MRNVQAAALAIYLGICSATAVSAATLSTAAGDVLVNTGRGFVRGQQGQVLNPGDRVMVGNGGGNATVSYDLSCFQSVNVGTVVTVRQGIPCENPATTTNPAPLGNVPTEIIVLGGAAVIGGGVLIYNATKSSSP